MSSLHLRNVTVPGPLGRPLLDDVDLDVPDGSSFALIGPSAEARTTLLRTLVGLDVPSAGQVLVDDTDVTLADPRTRDLSLVFADHALYPHLDVASNLSFSARLQRGVDREQLAVAVLEVSDALGLGDVLPLKPGDLGPDQQQRVAVGRSLVREASAYLFDDPFSAQAERIRPHVRSVVQQWQDERRRTSVFTTSLVAEALSLADQVAVLHQGRVHQVGTPRDLYERPADMFVAGYVGAPPMNLLPAFPQGDQLVTPLAPMFLDHRLREAVGDRNVVIVGIRPEHCLDATRGGVQVTDKVEFTTRVDEVEWRGSEQYAHLGYEMEEDLVAVLDEVEEMFEFDLFQNFLTARISALSPLKAGMSLHIVVPLEQVHLFDPVTGENLRIPTD